VVSSLLLLTCLHWGTAQTGFSESIPQTADRPTVILVTGAPGEDEFGESFSKSAGLWEEATGKSGAKLVAITATNAEAADRDRVQKALADEVKETTAELWVVLLGHGTFDGKEPKFNLRGPDFSAHDLANWLQPFRRPLAIICGFSASGPFLNKLGGTNRVVITATRSGHEVNYARLGGYLSETIVHPEADLDKDGQTSLLEAYLMAARRTAEFYQTEGRLATEHSLIDDNSDGLGTPPDWFRGIRATKKAKDGAALDGFRAHQFHLLRSETETKLSPEVRARRDELELQINHLRETKSELDQDDYYQKLEKLLLEMARLYEQTNDRSEKPKADSL
jgi:hypothetical protein